MLKSSKDVIIVLGAIAFALLLAIGTFGIVFITVQSGVTAVQRSNASVFEVFNARVNRIEKAIASPESSASASATPAVKKPVKAVVPSPAQ